MSADYWMDLDTKYGDTFLVYDSNGAEPLWSFRAGHGEEVCVELFRLSLNEHCARAEQRQRMGKLPAGAAVKAHLVGLPGGAPPRGPVWRLRKLLGLEVKP